MTDRRHSDLPCVVLFNINGSGMGHMSTCLAYANRLRHHARPVFFSLTSAMEIIHAMGFEGDYFVSRFWSRADAWNWDRQLSQRLGLLFERVRPDAIVFDGTWPYRGLLHAVAAYAPGMRMIWSDLTLYKAGWQEVPVSKENFDLVIKLGELGSRFKVNQPRVPARTVTIPPFTMLRDDELLGRDDSRDVLGLDRDAKFALFSLGPGNLKNISDIGRNLIREVSARGYTPVWTRTPISTSDVELPDNVIPISIYPLVRYMRAFDVIISAAGYNSCCEIIQSKVPTLFVPNTLVSDDQAARAELVAKATSAIVSPCESKEQCRQAVDRLLAQVPEGEAGSIVPDLSGAECAADEILGLIQRG